MLRHLNKKFYHQIVTTPMIEKEISLYAGYSVKGIFTQYLTTTQIPSFDYISSMDGKTLKYRYSNAVNDFYLPLQIKVGKEILVLKPKVNQWQTIQLTPFQIDNLNLENVKNYFYINMNGRKEVQIKMN
jgi:hypothetical protein